ncbi:MAG: UDP-N-acetylglucosamine 1-carboxyvinyltransferase, partial [Oscillospiraceae bacterium]|nr:UDP-N-acetylglucosamine 1-carboxyvinyltransferase [Oscillospiraceae bacterium]
MEKFLVKGGNTLSGEINIGGAKNAAVAILPATVMARGRCVIENVPDISDVRVLLDILSQLGAKIEMLSNDTVAIDTTDINSNEVPYELAKMIRASYYFIGALLGRCSEAHVSMPGGCNLGVRPIDQHLKGFQALGAEVTVDGGIIHAKADRMLGSHIHFDVVSVGATINVMMAAVRAHGITI